MRSFIVFLFCEVEAYGHMVFLFLDAIMYSYVFLIVNLLHWLVPGQQVTLPHVFFCWVHVL